MAISADPASGKCYCSKCGWEVRPGAIFCAVCGEPLFGPAENQAEAPGLHELVAVGDAARLALALDAGLDVNGLDEHGMTPLDVAHDHGNREAAELLVARGGRSAAFINRPPGSAEPAGP